MGQTGWRLCGPRISLLLPFLSLRVSINSKSHGGEDGSFFSIKATMSALWKSTSTTFVESTEALVFANGRPHTAIGGDTGPVRDVMWLSRAAGDVDFFVTSAS